MRRTRWLLIRLEVGSVLVVFEVMKKSFFWLGLGFHIEELHGSYGMTAAGMNGRREGMREQWRYMQMEQGRQSDTCETSIVRMVLVMVGGG